MLREVIVHLQYEDGTQASLTLLIPVAEHTSSFAYNTLPESIDTMKITGMVVKIMR